MAGNQATAEHWVAEIIDVIRDADYVRSLYRKKLPDLPVYSVDYYIELIGNMMGYDIGVRTAKWESYHIRGGCLHFADNTATILVAEHLDVDPKHGVSWCEQRYITMKELAHLVIDHEGSFVDDCKDFIDDILFDNISLTDFSTDGRYDIFYGKIFAMELLFPWENRENVAHSIKTGVSTYSSIAENYKIPEIELRWFLSDKLHPHLKIVHGIYDSASAAIELGLSQTPG